MRCRIELLPEHPESVSGTPPYYKTKHLGLTQYCNDITNHTPTPQAPIHYRRRWMRLVNFACPFTPICGGLQMLMGRRVRRRALGLHNDVDLFPSVSTDLLPPERIVDLLRSGEYSGGAAPDLRNDGKGRQLACAAGAVILQNLGEFGEQGERQRAELCDCKHTSRCGEEGDARC